MSQSRHSAAGHHRTSAPGMKLMSYSQAEKLAKLATFYNAVTVSQEENYLNEVAYLKALQTQKQQARSQLAAAQRAQPSVLHAHRAAAAPAPRRRRPRPPAAPRRRVRLRCHQHQHGGLGLHPPARIGRQLRRVQRRRLPVRAGHVGGPDRPRHAGAGLAARRAGRRRAPAVRRARLGALDHAVRLRPLEEDAQSPANMAVTWAMSK